MQLVESLDQLAEIRDEWHTLLSQTLPGRDLFYRVDMLRAMAPVHAAGRRSPFVLLAREAGVLVGAMPLVLDRKPLSRAGVRVLSLWGGDGSALSVEGGLPVRGDPEHVVMAMHDALVGELRSRFDLLEFGYLRGDCVALPALRRIFATAEWAEEPLTSHHLQFTATFAEYRATRSGSRVRELGRLKRKLEAAHAVQWHIASALTEAQLADVLQLHTARQTQLTARGRHREFVARTTAHRTAIAAVLQHVAQQGIARHHLLYADGTLIAFLLTLEVGDTVLAWLTAIDDACTPFGPGGLIFWEAVCSEFARGGVQRMEFGPGHTFVKETVCTHVLHPMHMRWLPPNGGLSALRVHAYRTLVQLRARLG